MEGKIAIITGGSKGIGAATARRFVKDGAKVMINYASDSKTAEALVSELGADKAAAVQADAGSAAGVDAIVAATVQKYGRLDVVVANAGTMLNRGLMDTTDEDFTHSFDTNVRGPFFLVQKAVPHMSDGGRIVLLSTSLAINSSVTPNYMLYLATKGAVEQMTRVMAKELGPKGITVNAVAPGPTATELYFKGKPDQVLKAIASSHPQGRIGEPDEIAGAIRFVAGNDGSWVNGQILYTNGGAMV